MKKSLLERFIAKYNLAGVADGVTWKADKVGVSTQFITDDKHIVGEIKALTLSLEPGSYSIYETPALKGLLSVLDDDLTVKVNSTSGKSTSLTFKDDNSKVTFVLADPANIPDVPSVKKLPPFENIITLDKSFIDRFIRAKSALSDIDTCTVISDGKTTEVIIGYDSNNTNRVSITAATTLINKVDPIDFHARYMKEIFVANKEAESGTLEVSSHGLARIQFTIDDFEVTYYLPQIKRES